MGLSALAACAPPTDGGSSGSITIATCAGECVEVVAGFSNLVTIDSANLYVGASAGITRVPLGGGPATSLTALTRLPIAMVVDASALYWADAAEGTIMRVPLSGGTPATIASGLVDARGIAVDATSVYWVLADGSVSAAPIGGGDVRSLAPAREVSSSSGLYGANIAVDASNVYWTYVGTSQANYSDGAVLEVPLAGGSTTVIMPNAAYPTTIAVDAANVYWLTSEGVVRAPVAGGTPVSGVRTTDPAISMAIDAANVYLANLGSDPTVAGGSVSAVPLVGGDVVTLATGLAFPSSIAVDATSVYVANEGTPAGRYMDGGVLKLTPK